MAEAEVYAGRGCRGRPYEGWLGCSQGEGQVLVAAQGALLRAMLLMQHGLARECIVERHCLILLASKAP